MHTSISELRKHLSLMLQVVQKGEDVIIHSHNIAIAKITPLSKKKSTSSAEEYGFGMWEDHEDMKNVQSFSRKLRKGRKHDI